MLQALSGALLISALLLLFTLIRLIQLRGGMAESQGLAQRLAEEMEVPCLGEVPIEQEVRETSDEGHPIVIANPDSLAAQAFEAAARNIVRQVTIRNATQPPTSKVEILHR